MSKPSTKTLLLLTACAAALTGGSTTALAGDVPTFLKTVHGEFLTNLPAPSGGSAGVCVIDTGVNPTATPDSNLVHTENLDPSNTDTSDTTGHGTNVTQTITQTWKPTPIITIKTSEDGNYTSAKYIEAINECIYLKEFAGYPTLRTINLSLSGVELPEDTTLDYLERSIANAKTTSDVNVIAGVGNDGASSVGYPARFDATFAIGAVDGSGVLCSFSNYGDGLDLSASGCDMDVFDQNDTSQSLDGTSFSAPVANTAIAALRSYRTDLTAEQAETLLTDNAQTTSAGPVLDVAAAFKAAGLGDLVEKYTPAATTTDSGGSGNTDSGGSTGDNTDKGNSGNPVTSIEDLQKPSVKSKRLRNGRLALKLRDIPTGVTLQIKAGGKTKKLSTSSIKKGTVKLKVGKKKTLRVKLRYQHPELGNTAWVSFKVRDRG